MDVAPGWDCILALCTGIVDVAAMGILVDDCPRGHQSHRGKLRADAAVFYPVDRCFEHEYCWKYPPLCADSDRRTHAFPLIMLTRRVSIDRRRTFLPAYKCRLLNKGTWLTKKSFTPLPTLLFTRSD